MEKKGLSLQPLSGGVSEKGELTPGVKTRKGGPKGKEFIKILKGGSCNWRVQEHLYKTLQKFLSGKKE